MSLCSIFCFCTSC